MVPIGGRQQRLDVPHLHRLALGEAGSGPNDAEVIGRGLKLPVRAAPWRNENLERMAWLDGLNSERDYSVMTGSTNLNQEFTFPGTSLRVRRMGYGAMQLAGRDGDKVVWGPPRDIPAAIEVLRQAVASGVNHIDTSDYYGPHVTNQI